jgi:hypothetical protein
MTPQNHNIVFNRVFKNDSSFYFMEDSPILPDENLIFPLYLCMDSEGKLFWSPEKIQEPIVTFQSYHIPGLFHKDGKIGIGREPLYTYKFDIAVSENIITTAFHVGDGRFGFSMGNGTDEGFLPEIIGMGGSEEDAGLYFIGRAGNSLPSDIPLIIIDGRNSADEELRNRPIFGITSADYRNYKFVVDQKGNIGIGKKPEIYKMEVNGEISAKDFIVRGISISDIIREHKEEIEQLKNKIEVLTGQKKNKKNE